MQANYCWFPKGKSQKPSRPVGNLLAFPFGRQIELASEAAQLVTAADGFAAYLIR